MRKYSERARKPTVRGRQPRAPVYLPWHRLTATATRGDRACVVDTNSGVRHLVASRLFSPRLASRCRDVRSRLLRLAPSTTIYSIFTVVRAPARCDATPRDDARVDGCDIIDSRAVIRRRGCENDARKKFESERGPSVRTRHLRKCGSTTSACALSVKPNDSRPNYLYKNIVRRDRQAISPIAFIDLCLIYLFISYVTIFLYK